MYVNKRSSNDANNGAMKELEHFEMLFCERQTALMCSGVFFILHLILKARSHTFIHYGIGLVPLLEIWHFLFLLIVSVFSPLTPFVLFILCFPAIGRTS